MKFQRIQDLRTDADLSQRELSEILHISQRSYSHYETDPVIFLSKCLSGWQIITTPASIISSAAQTAKNDQIKRSPEMWNSFGNSCIGIP